MTENPAEIRKSILARRRKGAVDPALRVEVEHEWGATFTVGPVRQQPDSVVFVIADGRRP
jgi:hypothetical protein